MWEMSAPGGEAEGCFLRAPQTEYYIAKEDDPDHLSFYPDVHKFYLIIRTADFTHLDVVSTLGSFCICICTGGYFRRLFFHS